MLAKFACFNLKSKISAVNLLILGISPLTSFILALREALVALVEKLLISGILSSIFFFMSALYTSFLTTSFFTASFGLLKSTGTAIHSSTSNLSSLLFKLLKLVGTFISLSISNLSTIEFKLGKSAFLATFDYIHICCSF